jgi:hypothetical protein
MLDISYDQVQSSRDYSIDLVVCTGKLHIGGKCHTAASCPSLDANELIRCQKCYYEGPMMGKDKASRSFDNRVRVSNGIRYRWVFLAKSHTFTRSIAKCTDGSFGTFGCM